VTTIYEWAPNLARYRDPTTGRFVSRDTIRAGVDQFIVASQARITAISEELRSGKINLAQWQTVMREEIKTTQLMAEALLRGGWEQMTQADYGRVGQRIREQYAFLEDFTDKLRSGEIRTDGQFMNYARMYATSARVGFHEGLEEQMQNAGYTEELNVLHPAEHCDECVAATATGWVPIGTNKPIGTRKCLGNDKCQMKYR
jgi:hypothetical protein